MKDIKEISQETKKELQKLYPNTKFSITLKRYSGGQSLDVSILESDIKIWVDGEERKHEQVNHYHYKTHDQYTDEAKQLFEKVCEVTNRENFDNSDPQTDYFNVGFYFH